MSESKVGSSLPEDNQQHDDNLSHVSESRRAFVKMAAYVPPAILTLKAAPAYAKSGSVKPVHPTHPTHPTHPQTPNSGNGPNR